MLLRLILLLLITLNDICRAVFNEVAHQSNFKNCFFEMQEDLNKAKPKNIKQVSNIQHMYCNLMNSIKKKLKYAANRSDIIQHIQHYPLRQVVFYTEQSIVLMKHIHKIQSNTTFNMWEKFVTFVVYKNFNLKNKIFVGLSTCINYQIKRHT